MAKSALSSYPPYPIDVYCFKMFDLNRKEHIMCAFMSQCRIVILFVVAFAVCGCQYFDGGPLSQSDITAEIAQRAMNPLIIKNTSRETIILFKRGDEVGCFYGTKSNLRGSKHTSIKTSFQPFFQRNIAGDSVVIIQTKALGKEYYCVLINDADLQQKTNQITITYEDGVEARFEKDVPIGVVFVRYIDEPHSTYSKVSLYDARGNELLFVTPEDFR